MDTIRDLLRPAARMPSDMALVQAKLVDAEHAKAIVTLLDLYAQEKMGIGRPLSDDVKKRIVPGLRQHPAAIAILAFRTNEPVGVTVCFRGFSTFQGQAVVNVHDLFVKREFRGRQIGRELLRFVERKAQSIGAAKITLEVREDNKPALRLYESDGFEGQRAPDGRPRTLFLEKTLPPRKT